MKVFKNPNRGNQKHVVPEPYTPEHERLNKSPTIMSNSREEFRRQPPKVVPPQVKVNSGQNADNWTEAQALAAQQRILAQTSPPQVKSFYNEPMATSAIPDFSAHSVEEIDDDEVDNFPQYQSSDFPDNPNEGSEVTANIDFTSIQAGEYILMYDNDIIASGSVDEITEIVEKILTSDEYNVSVEKIVVLKKMNLRTGVLISE